uniref:Uncharacterized protein n=1 Tax=Anguilla anguilla TaxID=7936 RepID=A0A0E9UHU8_ANGAN
MSSMMFLANRSVLSIMTPWGM